MDKVINEIYTCLTNFLTEDEKKLKLLIKIQVRKCLNYMNREDFPTELIEPLAEAIALEYLEEGERETKRITAGDTSVEYNSSSSVTDRVEISMREQLNRFRRVGVIGTTTQK
jgi:hypothetical protein